MAQTDDKYIVRLPPGMRDRVKERAARNRRSMNAEILLAIEAQLAANEGHSRKAQANVSR